MRRVITVLSIVMVCLCAAGLLVYQVPAVRERLSVRIDQLKAEIKYALNPPEEAVFVPQQGASPTPAYPLIESFPTPTLDLSPSKTPTGQPEPTATATLPPTETPIPTPRPGRVQLNGILHEYQMWNNCGPANLAMALSYWDWRKDQRETAAFLKPNPRDHNVMPYEMVDFVTQKTEFRALFRVGGDLDTLKRFIAAGYPVIVEKGFEGARFDGWMGHYEVVTGYDDEKELFTVQDSYNGPNLFVKYAELPGQWRAFNYTYILVYPADRGLHITTLLGDQADVKANYQHALDLATRETQELAGRDLYFAWFNRGSSLVGLKDYAEAATAFDAAFANYPSIPEKTRPWRMLWYQTGPYFAYYYSQRYQDVVSLATTTLNAMSEPNLEESYYWRAMAEVVLGDNEHAITDLRLALKYHPNFQPSLDLLAQLGQEP